MKKAITYVLVSNVAELLPFLTYVALNIPLALATVTMLCISVGTDFVSIKKRLLANYYAPSYT